MDERDEPTLGSPARLRVDQLESGSIETRHLGSDVLRREGEMMKSLPTTLDEPSNHAVGFEGFQEFDSNGPGAEESHPFFFQAEDGIRDKLVTGVQTCALPI